MRKQFYAAFAIVIAINIAFYFLWEPGLYSILVFGPLFGLGFRDIRQHRHAIKANFPIIGHLRYLLESIRPEMNQYFIESNTDGKPFSREQRSIVYQRAKKALETLPFGTQQDVYAEGYEFVCNSMYPVDVDPKLLRVEVGSSLCAKPYSLSILNIAAMSFGALSKNSILALNGAAKDGSFAHNTGEGGISPYHLEYDGDLIWQIGTAYFGCRTPDGKFDPDMFRKNATLPQVKMIEIKLSQGAKPGHGGILSGSKVTHEIAEIRGVEPGKDVISPPAHTAFHDAPGLLEFIARLRELSGGKPVGIKLCLGHPNEFENLVELMVDLKCYPDYIAVDGGEGGTGAAPLEFTNHIGLPGLDALVLIVDILKKRGLKDEIKVLASGKITSAFDILKFLCVGADATYAARSMMLALGCIQALRCNNNKCPVGVATQNPWLVSGLHVPSKRERVKNFHQGTLEALAHMMGAMGVSRLADLKRHHLHRRVTPNEIRTYAEIYPEPGVVRVPEAASMNVDSNMRAQ